MNSKVTKFSRILALAVATAFPLITSGLIQQAAAQKYSHRPKASAFTQQGSANAAATAVFNGGRDLIDDAQWAKAEETFAQYISKYPQEKNLDAAMYWMAYAQSKLRKYKQSRDTIDKLLKTYEKTIWKEDAELLLAQLPSAPVAVKIDPLTVTVEPVIVPAPVAVAAPVVVPVPPQDPVEVKIRTQEMQERMAEAQARAQERVAAAQERMAEKMAQAQAKMKDKDFKYDFDFNFDFDDFDYSVGKGVGKGKGSGDDDPCEFKIVVLQALFESDPQRGIAVAQDWLKPGSGQTVTCKRGALKLLARHGGKAVTPTILGFAQNETDLKLKTTAISLLGASDDDSVLNALRDFALNSTQSEVVEAAVYALGQHSSPQALNLLADVALSNRPVPLRKTAIRSIASRPGEPAVDALFKIYDSTQDIEIRKSVISGFGNRKSERAGAKLIEIARSSENNDLRRQAIRAIASRQGESAVDFLMNLYDSEKNEEVKDQIMSSFGNLKDQRVTEKLIAIAKNPQTPIERRRRAIGLLSGRKDPAVIKLLDDLARQP
jgi:HEAT repeat protein